MPTVYIRKPHHKQEKEFSCIPACVRMLLEFYDVKITESELRIKLKTKFFGTHIINILKLSDEPYGIEAKIDYWSVEELKVFLETYQEPCIVLVWTEFLKHWESKCIHAIIVNGFDEENVIINDPHFEQSEFFIPFDDFTNAWQINDGLVVLFTKSKLEEGLDAKI